LDDSSRSSNKNIETLTQMVLKCCVQTSILPPLPVKVSRNFMVRMFSKYVCKTFLLRTRKVCYTLMHTFMKYINLQYWQTLRVSHSEATDFVFESLVKQTENRQNYHDLTFCSTF